MSLSRPLQPLDSVSAQILDLLVDGMDPGTSRTYEPSRERTHPFMVTRTNTDPRIYVLERQGDEPFDLALVHYDGGKGNGPRWYPIARRSSSREVVAIDVVGDDLRVHDTISSGALRTYASALIVSELRRCYRPWRLRNGEHAPASEDSTRLAELARSFPALADAPIEWPIDPGALAAWACAETTAEAGRHAARFVLALEQPDVWPFDVLEALAIWSASDRSAFLRWASAPWRPRAC